MPDPFTVRPSQDPSRTPNGLAKRPPMGWNSWNKFGCNINEKIARDTADAMVSSGMKDAGYEYLVIDDCWHGKRDSNGFITADPEKFPSGMKALADYVHSKGLKFGIYSDVGRMTCGKRPGSQGHEYQDALTYARWGVDYLKYDWCYTGSISAEDAYALMSDALRSTGRDIVLSICDGHNQRAVGAEDRQSVAHHGRYHDKWKARTATVGILNIVDMNERCGPTPDPVTGTTRTCSKSAMAASNDRISIALLLWATGPRR